MPDIKGLLLTGGTGSFGKEFVKSAIKKYPSIERLIIYSRDELKQWEMQQQFPKDEHPELRFFLGDVRDADRLYYAMEGIDTVVHAAALKQVPAAEYNPMEFIKTNVIGAENVIQACLKSNVQRVVALSTDKAAAPVNLYGATKLCSDKLFIAANNIKGKRDLRFSVVRYGNVMGSRGSVIPLFLKMSKQKIKELTVTDPNMSRFNITLKAGVEMVCNVIDNSIGSEIFVPKIPSYKVHDVAEAIAPSCKKIIVGIRPGEKVHEEMITSSDSPNTYDIGKYYIILPSGEVDLARFSTLSNDIRPVNEGFCYNSGTNPHFIGVNEIRRLIVENIDPAFVPV